MVPGRVALLAGPLRRDRPVHLRPLVLYGSPSVSARSASRSAAASAFAYCASGSPSSQDRTSGSTSISNRPGIPPRIYTTSGMREPSAGT